MLADLHTHSTASDGVLAPAQLIARAARRGLGAIALCDHDTVDGLREADAAAREHGIAFIPGVELSAVHEGHDVHVLGYFVRADDAQLRAHLADLRAARVRRAEAIVAALRAAGYAVTIDDVLELSAGGSVGRSHVARALVRGGHAEDIRDAFERLLGRGRPFYVPKDVRSPAEVVQVVLDAGGVPVLAHPGVTKVDSLIPDLVDAGLIGIEAYHAEHAPADRLRYAKEARRLGLLVTGGSDFHGPGALRQELGSVELPAGTVERLLEAAAAHS